MNSRQAIAFVVFCGIGIAALASHLSNAPTKTGREICNGITNAKILKVQQIANEMQLLPGRYGEITEVDERVWAELPHDSKLALALTVYCSLDKGKTDLILRGWRDGETKASLINGIYLD